MKKIETNFKKFIKMAENKTILKQILKNNAQKYCVCNGYALVEYGEQENVPQELQGYIDIYKMQNGEYCKIDFCYDDYKNKVSNLEECYISTKKIDEIIKFNKENKLKNYEGLFYEVGKDCINVEYLKILLILCKNKNENVKVLYNSEFAFNPIFFEFENGIKAMQLPVHMNYRTYDKQAKLSKKFKMECE